MASGRRFQALLQRLDLLGGAGGVEGALLSKVHHRAQLPLPAGFLFMDGSLGAEAQVDGGIPVG